MFKKKIEKAKEHSIWLQRICGTQSWPQRQRISSFVESEYEYRYQQMHNLWSDFKANNITLQGQSHVKVSFEIPDCIA